MRLCIISNQPSDLSELLTASVKDSIFLTQDEAANADLNIYDAFAYLCGTSEEGHTPSQNIRNKIDEQIRQGKKVFSEYCKHIGPLKSYDTTSTRYERPVAIKESPLLGKLELRTILDEQSNDRIHYLNATGTPIFQYYKNPFGFYKVPESIELPEISNDYALFFETESFLVCSFRLCNFAKAAFAPRNSWCMLIFEIVKWLGGECVPEDVYFYFDRVYRLRNENADIKEVIKSGLQWFENADMLTTKYGMPYGVKEGLGAHVYADGKHNVNEQLRPDCVGELSVAYYMYYLVTGDKRMLAYSDGLMRGVLDCQDKVPGPFYGMMRWTPTSWWTCYPDDAARALLMPGLLRALVGGDRTYMPQVKECLDFIISITGTLGHAPGRIDFEREDLDKISYWGSKWNEEKQKWDGVGYTMTKEEMRNTPILAPSAHYQAFSLASMLLYYKLTGEKKYLEVGLKGIETIMSYYPKTAREHSETQEYCRLMLPLSILWSVADDIPDAKPEYKEWLYRVAKDLNNFRHEKGGFKEWDTGYISACAGVKDGESSVLAENGDPVTDLLYSVNWLPTAINLAYAFTKDEYFREMRDYTMEFFCQTQVVSPDRMLDGIWPRSINLDTREVYGVPNDVGWAPWSVETGWTMGEILTGMSMTLLDGKY